MLGLTWGAIGSGFFMYGKKMGRGMFLICGILLCVFPMFLSSDLWSLILGVTMTVLPFKLEL